MIWSCLELNMKGLSFQGRNRPKTSLCGLVPCHKGQGLELADLNQQGALCAQLFGIYKWKITQNIGWLKCLPEARGTVLLTLPTCRECRYSRQLSGIGIYWCDFKHIDLNSHCSHQTPDVIFKKEACFNLTNTEDESIFVERFCLILDMQVVFQPVVGAVGFSKSTNW